MAKIETYQQIIEFLYKQLPVYQRDGKSAYKASLDNIRLLDNNMGQKHKSFKTIHVAGTNGKGSVSHMLSSVLQSAGYRTGLYTSPHLKDFRERIRIDGEMIPKNELIEFVNLHQSIFDDIHPSFFELTVAIAFNYFAKEKVDIAIIETGLGGRLDSTNIISPELSVITNIGYDHTQFLGNTLQEIAGEKGGIIKENTPVVIGESHPETEFIFKRIANEKKSVIYFADKQFFIEYGLLTLDKKQQFSVKSEEKIIFEDIQIDLLGTYQQKNVLTTLQAIEILNNNSFAVSREAIYSGLQNIILNTGLQGKWQITGNNPLMICDTAHNKEGLEEVIKQIESTPYKNLHMIIGFVNDKNITPLLQILPKEAKYYVTKASIPRALDEKIVLDKLRKTKLKGDSYKKVKEAVLASKKNAGKDDLIFVCGSSFVVAEVI